MMEEAIEFLHDCRLHDLSEKGVLFSQLLGTEVLPTARRPLVVVEEVDEGCIGRLGEQLLVDICEEPGEAERSLVRGLKLKQKPLQELAGGPGPATDSWVQDQSGYTLEGHA